ncbi:hydrogenase maturation protease [Tautonia sp. JC769]|uniref:hydrogenase maturation protease n=1 Tax=Tautonia sp. JC769 TaxID=3232135 RepID=UPI003459D8A0
MDGPSPAFDDDRPVLVIGFGNLLRGDDGVGPRVAEAVAGWNLSGVVALAVHQLLPELAESLSHARFVIFADADVGPPGGSVIVSPLAPRWSLHAIAHVSDPPVLLALAQALYGRCPPAILLRIPVRDVNVGCSLSPLAETGARQALHRIALHLAEQGVVVRPDMLSPARSRTGPHAGRPPELPEGLREQDVLQ